NREAYTYYESSFVGNFRHAMQAAPFPNGIRPYIDQLRGCFFSVPVFRFFIPDTLSIPLPYYWLLVPGFVLALWHKRFEIVLLAILPAVGVFISGGPLVEHRMLLAIPFWIILMAFAFAGLLTIKLSPALKILLLGVSTS